MRWRNRVTALALALTVLLLLETLPSAVAQLTRSRAGLNRLDQLTRLGVTQGRNLRAIMFLGAAHVIGSGAVIAGLFAPAAGIAGAGLETGVFSWVVSRQLSHGDRGRALGAYLTFTVMALAVLTVDAIRLS
jgi:hypothetical protein